MNLKGVNKNWLMLGGAMALGIGALYLNDKAISSRMQELEAEAAKGREMVTVVVPVRDHYAATTAPSGPQQP